MITKNIKKNVNYAGKQTCPLSIKLVLKMKK